MVPRGLEPRTLRLLAVRSDQLSYETDAYPTFFPYRTGRGVKIPSILLSHYEGDKLIEAVRKADETNEAV